LGNWQQEGSGDVDRGFTDHAKREDGMKISKSLYPYFECRRIKPDECGDFLMEHYPEKYKKGSGKRTKKKAVIDYVCNVCMCENFIG